MSDKNKPSNEKPTPGRPEKGDENRPPTSSSVLKEYEKPATSMPTLRFEVPTLPAKKHDKKGKD